MRLGGEGYLHEGIVILSVRIVRLLLKNEMQGKNINVYIP
jgi:hypothetical protein